MWKRCDIEQGHWVVEREEQSVYYHAKLDAQSAYIGRWVLVPKRRPCHFCLRTQIVIDIDRFCDNEGYWFLVSKHTRLKVRRL